MSEQEKDSKQASPSLSEQDEEALKAFLINEEGDLTEELEAALKLIFARFSSSFKASGADSPRASDVLTTEDLDAFALAANGAPLPDEAKQEIREFLSTDDDGNLTLGGFCEMFHLQSDNEPAETWRDLERLGFNRKLEFVGTEKAEQKEAEKKGAEPERKAHSDSAKSAQGESAK